MAIVVDVPRPKRCLPARTKSASLKRVDEAPGRAVTHPEEGPLAALNMRAAPRRPWSVEVSNAARKEAPSRSPTTRDTRSWTRDKVSYTNVAGRFRMSGPHPKTSAQSSKTRRHTSSKGSRRAPLKGIHVSLPPYMVASTMAAPERRAASASMEEVIRKPKPPCLRGRM